MPENYDVAVYYDAWENDNGTDPVLSLVYEIIKQLGINYALMIIAMHSSWRGLC